MKTDDNGHIESFVEKPHASQLEQWASVTSEEMQQAGKIYLASMGIYIFNKKPLLRLLSENPETTDFGKEIIPKAMEDMALFTSNWFSGYWEVIGTIGPFFDSNLDLFERI